MKHFQINLSVRNPALVSKCIGTLRQIYELENNNQTVDFDDLLEMLKRNFYFKISK